MSAQDRFQFPRSLPHQRARAKKIKTHGRRVGISLMLVLAALVVTSFLPSGVHATSRKPSHSNLHELAPFLVTPARLTMPNPPAARSLPSHVR